MKRRDLIKLLEKNGWTFKRAAEIMTSTSKAMKGKLWSGTVKSQKRLHRPLSEGGG